MINDKSEQLIMLRNELKDSFDDLYNCFEQHGDDGVCISDVEFSLVEFRGKLEELDVLLST